MDRRFFLEAAALIAPGFGLLNTSSAQARGIPASCFPDLPADGCYPEPPAGRICTSITDLFKIGPGPSSSHTLAPMRIASNFRSLLETQDGAILSAGTAIEAHVFGSLSSTGKGYRTDRAILAGIMGQKPDTCDPAVMKIREDENRQHEITISGKKILISHVKTILWDDVKHDYPFQNTMVMQFVDENGTVLVDREYYLTGGGFFSWKGQAEEKRGDPVHVYGSMAAFKALLAGALIGFLYMNNASLAGSEVGCQGEIGVVSAMAAAMTAYAMGASINATEGAATIALEHHLGMSCDPFGGFVLIPCIECNAFGALKAYNACLMGKSEIVSEYWEDLDRVIMAMLQTGKALPHPFKEMGTGGLGMTLVGC